MAVVVVVVPQEEEQEEITTWTLSAVSVAQLLTMVSALRAMIAQGGVMPLASISSKVKFRKNGVVGFVFLVLSIEREQERYRGLEGIN